MQNILSHNAMQLTLQCEQGISHIISLDCPKREYISTQNWIKIPNSFIYVVT